MNIVTNVDTTSPNTSERANQRQLHRSPAPGRWYCPRCLLHVYEWFHYQRWQLVTDGGHGVGCAVNFQGTYAHTYNLDVHNTEDTTWTGTAIDTKTGKGLLCSELPHMSVVFGLPKTDTGVGILNDIYEVGACASHDNFKFTSTADKGVDISADFPANLKAVFCSQTYPEEEYGTGNGL